MSTSDDSPSLRQQLLSDEEQEKIVEAFMEGVEPGGTFYPEDIEHVLRWARHIRTMNAALEMVLLGHLYPTIKDDGEVGFLLVEDQEEKRT